MEANIRVGNCWAQFWWFGGPGLHREASVSSSQKGITCSTTVLSFPNKMISVKSDCCIALQISYNLSIRISKFQFEQRHI